MKKVVLVSLLLSSFFVQAEETSIVSMATENGVKKCKGELKSTADFILKDKAHGTHASWNNDDSDNHLYSTLTTKSYSDGDSHVTVIAAPTTSGKCDTTYVETFVMPKPCMMVREEVFKAWKYSGTMNKKTLLLESDSGGVNVYLSPQGENICLVSRREVIYP